MIVGTGDISVLEGGQELYRALTASHCHLPSSLQGSFFSDLGHLPSGISAIIEKWKDSKDDKPHFTK